MNTVHFIFPVYNEKENLKDLIGGIRQLMAGRSYRMIAVNDGSTDGSLSLLNDLTGDELIVTGSQLNMNVGAAFSTGITAALAGAADEDAVVIMESDQTSEQELILPMVQMIFNNEAEIVIASRYLPGGKYTGFPLPRLVFSHIANRLMRTFFPVASVLDYTIFFRAYRAGLLRRASTYFGPFGLIQSKGFEANAELLVKLSLLTKNIREIPFVYDYGNKKGASKIHVLSTIKEYFALIGYLRRILARHVLLKGVKE
ncbi:MAG: glycosyltransferase [Deltaproteobacteria bacterium]|nr:glycosyltransferase [Deltaproteobacteria bacterium]